MKVSLTAIEIQNYRGIQQCDVRGLRRLNLIVGPNGVGKSSLANAVARFLPFLYGWPQTIRDGDLRFTELESAAPLLLRYQFDLELTRDEAQSVGLDCDTEVLVERCLLRVTATRRDSGPSKGMLNAGEPAETEVKLVFLAGDDSEVAAPEGLGRALAALDHHPRTLVMGGVKAVPEPDMEPSEFEPVVHVSLMPGSGKHQVIQSQQLQLKSAPHAATSDRPFVSPGSLRARLHQLLTNGEKAMEVEQNHPGLIERILNDYNALRGSRQFVAMAPGSGSEPFLCTAEGTWVLWSGLSAGEQAIFGFAMLEEVSITRRERFVLIVEEPETNVHVSLQAHLLRRLQKYSDENQVFVSTHSTGFLEVDELAASDGVFLLSPQDAGIEVVEVSTLAPSDVLQQLGMTARSVGQARVRVLVEGISDAAVFQSCLEQLVPTHLASSLPGLVEFVVCGGPGVVRTHSVVDSGMAPTLVADDLVENAQRKLNLARPGVVQFVLFDPDGDATDVAAFMRSMEQLNRDGVTVIEPWYRTLESLYSPDMWWAAYPGKRKKEAELPPAVLADEERRWMNPHAVVSALFKKVPTPETLAGRKAKNGFRVAKYIRENRWAEDNRHLLPGLERIASAIAEVGESRVADGVAHSTD